MLHVGNYFPLTNVLKVEVVLLYGLEAIESQEKVGLWECPLTLLTKQIHWFMTDLSKMQFYSCLRVKLNFFKNISSDLFICFVSSFLLLLIRLPCMNIGHQSHQHMKDFNPVTSLFWVCSILVEFVTFYCMLFFRPFSCWI